MCRILSTLAMLSPFLFLCLATVRATLQPTKASPEGILVQRQAGSHKNSSVREEGGSYSLRRSHWFSGNPKRTRLESLGIDYSLLYTTGHVSTMCSTCVLQCVTMR